MSYHHVYGCGNLVTGLFFKPLGLPRALSVHVHDVTQIMQLTTVIESLAFFCGSDCRRFHSIDTLSPGSLYDQYTDFEVVLKRECA